MKIPIIVCVLLGAVLITGCGRESASDRVEVESGVETQPAPVVEKTITLADYRHDFSNGSVIFSATGSIYALQVEGKVLVDGNIEPPLVAELVRREGVSQSGNQLDGSVLAATFQPISAVLHEGGIRVEGAIEWDSGKIPARITYSFPEEEAVVQVQVHLDPAADFQGVQIRSLEWQLPLALDERKRVWMPGDHGMHWDTRYFYHFHTNTVGQLLKEPELNVWQDFAFDQESSDSFHLWRRETPTTSLLTMQRGQDAPPWFRVYDQSGGVVIYYPQLREHAPKSLRVHAVGGGMVKVGLWMASAQPLDATSADKQALFGVEHAIFISGHSAQEAVLAHVPDPEFADTPDSETLEPWLASLPLGTSEGYVVSGVPFPQGTFASKDVVRVKLDGKEVPVQSDPIGFWPDGSIKWSVLTFPLNPESLKQAGEEELMSRVMQLTLRDGSKRPVEVIFGQSLEPAVAQTVLSAHAEEESIEVSTGVLTVRFSKGENWLQSIRLQGRELLDQESPKAPAFVHYLRADENVVSGNRQIAGELDTSFLKVESLTLEETGPLRAVVKLEGVATGKEPTRIILRFQLFAGSGMLHCMHTAEFLFQDPRTTYLSEMGLVLPIAFDPETGTVETALEDEILKVPYKGTVALHQSNYNHYRVWKSENQTQETLATGAHTQGWIRVTDQNTSLTVGIRSMWQLFPKELKVDADQHLMTIGLWPASSHPMDVRRYSNYPHRSQGESVTDNNKWVTESYYPNDPFVGVSRSHEVYLNFESPDSGSAEVSASQNADFQSRPLVYAGADWYQSTLASIPEAPVEKFAPAYENLHNLRDFLLFHQKHYRWYGFWHFGDVQHHFRGGYGWIFSPEALLARLNDPELAKKKRPDRSERILDYFTQNDWAFDNGRWGWTNTEGLPNWMLQRDYLRTGDRDVFFAAEALARHSRDVVVRHDGKWFGTGTRHGVQHWSDGNHEERQTTATEYKLHYFLTGDHRTRDVIQKLSDKIYLQKRVYVDAAHSGRIQGLLAYAELAAEPARWNTLKTYIHTLITPEGMDMEPDIEFPAIKKVAASTDSLNGTSMFFHVFGGTDGLIEYYYLTKDEKLKNALVLVAEDFLKAEHAQAQLERGYARNGFTLRVIAFAAANADAPQPYIEYLQKLFSGSASENLHQIVSKNPEHWTGKTAWMTGNIPGSFFFANGIPFFLLALPEMPPLSKELQTQFEQDNTIGKENANQPGSWQSEYDNVPEFEAWFQMAPLPGG